MNIKPMKDRILVAQNAHEVKSAAGIIIEGRNLGNTAHATVLAVGPDVVDVAVGDVVYLDWSKASVVKVDGQERAMIALEHVLAVVEK